MIQTIHNGVETMKAYAATVTQRSQVTLPTEVRRLLGIKARDRVIFAIEDDQVRLLPSSFTLESAAGSVAALGSDVEPGAPADEVGDAAQPEVVGE